MSLYLLNPLAGMQKVTNIDGVVPVSNVSLFNGTPLRGAGPPVIASYTYDVVPDKQFDTDYNGHSNVRLTDGNIVASYGYFNNVCVNWWDGSLARTVIITLTDFQLMSGVTLYGAYTPGGYGTYPPVQVSVYASLDGIAFTEIGYTPLVTYSGLPGAGSPSGVFSEYAGNSLTWVGSPTIPVPTIAKYVKILMAPGPGGLDISEFQLS